MDDQHGTPERTARDAVIAQEGRGGGAQRPGGVAVDLVGGEGRERGVAGVVAPAARDDGLQSCVRDGVEDGRQVQTVEVRDGEA